MEYLGKIYTPDSIEKQHNAVLKIMQDVIELSSPLEFTDVKYPLVLGVFNNLGSITLINLKTKIATYSIQNNFIYEPEFIFTNVHFKEIDQITFDTAEIVFTSLFNWFNRRIVKSFAIENEFRFSDENDIIVKIDENIEFKFSFNLNKYRDNNKFVFEEFLSLLIIKKGGKLIFSEFVKILNHFSKFILFSTNENPQIDSISFSSIDFPSAHNKNALAKIGLFYNKSFIATGTFVYSPKIEFKDIEDNFEEVLSNWYSNQNIINCIDLILEKTIYQKLGRENTFLNDCFAIETYHRRISTTKPYTKEDFKRIKNEILQKFQEGDILKLLEKQLTFANEPSFRDRLSEFKTDFISVLPNNKNVLEYIGKIVKTRNYLVHRENEKGVFKNVEMTYASKYIEAVLIINILRKLGVKEIVLNGQSKKVKESFPQLYFYNKRLDTDTKLLY